MRVNPNTTPDLLAALEQTQRQEQNALLQLASGRRVNVPSDDPAAAAVLVGNHARTAQTDQFLRSIGSLQAQLQSTDSALSSVVTALQRAISLGVQGANGTLSDANRASLALEVQGIQDEIIGLANLSFQGSFVFGGTENQAPPFVADSTQPSGVRYDGNTGVNKAAVGDGLSVQMNLPGSQLFMAAGGDVFQSLHDLVVALQSNSGVDVAVADVRKAFDHVTAQRVFYGNALTQMQDQQIFLSSEKLQLSQQEDEVGGADLAAAATNLANAQTGRQAALQAAARLSGTNLFDYL
jgi:flagellar hook-associated protein 3 FlgL